LWQRFSLRFEYVRIDDYSVADRLREDIGLTEYETKSPSDWIHAARYKHVGHY
jgi:hypothetical protein